MVCGFWLGWGCFGYVFDVLNLWWWFGFYCGLFWVVLVVVLESFAWCFDGDFWLVFTSLVWCLLVNLVLGLLVAVGFYFAVWVVGCTLWWVLFIISLVVWLVGVAFLCFSFGDDGWCAWLFAVDDCSSALTVWICRIRLRLWVWCVCVFVVLLCIVFPVVVVLWFPLRLSVRVGFRFLLPFCSVFGCLLFSVCLLLAGFTLDVWWPAHIAACVVALGGFVVMVGGALAVY